MVEKLWIKSWPKGLDVSLDYPEIPVYKILESTAKLYPDKKAVIFKDTTFTYGELYEKARRFASALTDLGVGKGDVVSVHLPNCPQFMVAYHGIIMTGATFSPCNPMLSPFELKNN